MALQTGDYSDEDATAARLLTQKAIDDLRALDPAPAPAAVAEAYALMAAAMWSLAYDDPQFEHLRSFIAETRTSARRRTDN